jgi:hypothetical protein
MRGGSVQPLSVTTGRYGLPDFGYSGGAIVGLFIIGASGTAPIAALETAALANTAPAVFNKKSRRAFIALVALRFPTRHRGRGFHHERRAGGAQKCGLQIGVGQPKIPLGINSHNHAADLLAGIG